MSFDPRHLAASPPSAFIAKGARSPTTPHGSRAMYPPAPRYRLYRRRISLGPAPSAARGVAAVARLASAHPVWGVVGLRPTGGDVHHARLSPPVAEQYMRLAALVITIQVAY